MSKGMRLRVSLEKKVSFAFVVALGILLVLGYFCYRSLNQSITTAQLVGHSYQVIDAVQSVTVHLAEAEGDVDRYNNTGEEFYLIRHNAAVAVMRSRMSTLRQLATDDRGQQERLNRIEPLLVVQFSRLEDIVNARRNAGSGTAARPVAAGGAAVNDELRKILAEMEGEERTLLTLRQNSTAAEVDRTVSVLRVVTVSTLLLIGFVFLVIRTDFHARRKAEQMRFDLAAIVESSSDAIIGVSLDGLVTSWNRGADRLFGYTAREIIGRSCSVLLVPESAKLLSGIFERLRMNEELGAQELIGITKTRHRIQLLATCSVTRDLSGNIAGISFIAGDITERKKAEQQVRTALKMQSDFVSFVSHQLRTPLTGIKWLLELAMEQPDDAFEDARSLMVDAKASAVRLIELVNDLLDAARLESGKFNPTPQTIDLAEVTDEVIKDLEPLIRERDQELGFSRLSVKVNADPKLLREVTTNLLSNAVKYTPARGRICVALKRDEDGVRWEVTDSGIGVPEAGRARLFEKFFRADNAATLETEGTGLGLYLVRLMIEKSGGQVQYEAPPEGGSRFAFTLPLADQEEYI
jgi:PAS domain S-box-containing protein